VTPWYCIHSRDYAWEQCYRYFQLADSEFDEEIASLRLVSYLASWGMFRGSSNIRNYSHESFRDCVRVVRESIRVQNRIRFHDDPVDNLYRLFSEICKSLPQDISRTRTIITKIAHGTFCEFPALDRFVDNYLRLQKCKSGLSKRSIKKILELAAVEHIDAAEIQTGLPRMRIIDKRWMAAGR
jgi:hypothetical protein